jgi:hypothetical protein
MENMNVTLNLTLAECNGVLAALGAMPYAQVADLIAKIKQQGEDAIAEQKAVPAPLEEEGAPL